MNHAPILLAALLATFGAPVFAAVSDSEPGAQPRIVTREAIEIHTRDGDKSLVSSLTRTSGKVVKNAPYSAEVIAERQQNLADGNQIASKNTTFSYRDSAGRTRQEVRDDRGELLTISIHDPIEGATYMLNPRGKTATRIGANKEIGKAAAEAARSRLGQLRQEGKLPALERKEIIVRQLEGPDGKVEMLITPGTPLRIEAPQASFNTADMTLRLGPLTGAMADMKWASKATTKDLGTREIEGVKAEGKLRSYEIPAGEVGNRNPITVSDETWTSPELQVTLLHKHSDPRAGENSYRMTAVRREEPAAALFTVPSDYTVKDVMANVTRILEKQAP